MVRSVGGGDSNTLYTQFLTHHVLEGVLIIHVMWRYPRMSKDAIFFLDTLVYFTGVMLTIVD